jgi:hypothetical protein
MRDIDDILGHGDDILGHGRGQRRIVFEDGLWCIYEKRDGDIYALHRCETASYALNQDGVWECGVSEAHPEEAGYGCGETAPDSIKTLCIIYRWDR